MKMVILGAGESGTGAAMLGRKLGYDVFVTDAGKAKEKYRNILDKEGFRWEDGKHSEAFLEGADIVVKSPGIPDTAPVVQRFLSSGVELISEIEFASRHSKSQMVAITGTNGKTTTSNLTYHILAKSGTDVALAGNVGTSFAGALAERDREVFVLEVSSFQLDNIMEFKPQISCILNITPDHLDRYKGEMKNYIDSKFRITMNQSSADHFIYCADDEVVTKEVSSRNIQAQLHPFSLITPVNNGAYTKQDKLIINLINKPFEMSIHELALQGKHNTYNSMAAGVAARILEIRKEVVRESLADFQNVEHRLEYVATIHGIKFINDSKATNVNSTWYALESIREPIVWIVGGVDKGNDYSMLEDLVRQNVKGIICLGKDNAKLLDFFSPIIENIAEAGSAEEAVAISYRMANSGDTVLLSPACASFDLFENYEDRGQKFKMAVRSL